MPETTLANVYVCVCQCVCWVSFTVSFTRTLYVCVCGCVCLYVLPLLVWGFVLLINKHESRARARPIVCASVCVCVHSFEGVKISN